MTPNQDLGARQSGELVDWNDDAGYGFIRAQGTGARVFVHANDFARRMPRPQAGDRISFLEVAGREGRPAAQQARIELVAATEPEPWSADPVVPLRVLVRIGAALGLALVVAIGLLAGRVPAIVAWAYFAMGIASCVAYALDKSAAKTGAWRLSEARLHAIDLVGGIIGGLVAQALLRHKTSKTSFAAETGAIFVLHLALLAVAALGYFPAFPAA